MKIVKLVKKKMIGHAAQGNGEVDSTAIITLRN